ncbi:MAG: cell division protein FtsZ [Bacteroidales bacterium]|nr:cell division protein FtsZ [Bacteroidales bacterium]
MENNNKFLEFQIEENAPSIIKVLGVGGGGTNAVNFMYNMGIKGVDFIVCNTDLQALRSSPIPTKIPLGQSLTQGLGAGSNPEKGKQAAIESINAIEEALKTAKMVFITAGFGGGTGTGAAPIIAKRAKELGLLTIAIVTLPFVFEGKKRYNYAIEGIREIKNNVDSLLIINNEKIREIYGNLPFKEGFGKANEILLTAAKGIAEIITVPGYINVDFADVETVMKNSGVAIMGAGVAEGENRAINAVKKALNSPLLNNNDIKGAKNILLNISSGEPQITIDEIYSISDFIQKSTKGCDIILGVNDDFSLENKISVTIIATGFDAEDVVPESQKPKVHIIEKNDNKILHHKPQEQVIDFNTNIQNEEPVVYVPINLDLQDNSKIDEFDEKPAILRNQKLKDHKNSTQQPSRIIIKDNHLEINDENPYFRKKVD